MSSWSLLKLYQHAWHDDMTEFGCDEVTVYLMEHIDTDTNHYGSHKFAILIGSQGPLQQIQ